MRTFSQIVVLASRILQELPPTPTLTTQLGGENFLKLAGL